jgi:hypothetical protein
MIHDHFICQREKAKGGMHCYFRQETNCRQFFSRIELRLIIREALLKHVAGKRRLPPPH